MNPDFLVRGNLSLFGCSRVGKCESVKRDNANDLFFASATRSARSRLVHLGKTFRWWSVRLGRFGSGAPVPALRRATLARADETDQFSMATTACRRRRASVIEPSGLEARDASSRASEANTKEEKSISPPRNNRSRAARRLSPARARQPHALSGSILEPCRSHPSRLIDHPLAQRTTVPFST